MFTTPEFVGALQCTHLISSYVDEESPGRLIQGMATGKSMKLMEKNNDPRSGQEFSLSAHVR